MVIIFQWGKKNYLVYIYFLFIYLQIQLSIHKMLIDGLESCGLLVDFKIMFYELFRL